MSTELYLKLYVEKNGPIKARAVVIDVKERFFEVIDLSTRTLGRIYVDVSYVNGILKKYILYLVIHIFRLLVQERLLSRNFSNLDYQLH